MQITSVIQVGVREHFPPQVREAASLAFPEAKWTEVLDFAAVLSQADGVGGSGAGETLLLFGEDVPEAGTAGVLTDEDQLPRWGVAVFGGGDMSLPVEDWGLRALASALRAAADNYAAQRENAALRGHLLTMARRVSHDLRTPLGGIIATVDMLAEITPGGHEAVRPLFSSVDEITAIIARTGFLLKSIAEPPPKSRFSMRQPSQDAQLRLEKLITRRQATVSRPPTWPEVSGVESWVEVIWWNLLNNSLRHAGPQPVIELGWDAVSPADGVAAGSGCRFWIRDNGSGVAPSARGQLFRPFHLLHDPNAPRGFGLAIVRSLVEMQGGTCGYDPQPEGGAGFFFTLPDEV